VNDENFMQLALLEARAALEHGDVPVGAVAVMGSKVIARAHNERELRRDPTAHAEILLLQRAAAKLEDWRLADLQVYVTLEPCPMCAGALVAGRVGRLIYGASDPRAGAAYSIYNIVQDPRLDHACRITQGVLAEECARVLEAFFAGRRRPTQFL
jgi:tRNA(adenine34) deaminase